MQRFLLLEGFAVAGIVGSLLLLSLGPRFVGYSSFVVYGGSMEPQILKGSIAVAKPLEPASVRVGDVIIYRTQGAGLPTLHRVIAVEEIDGYVTVTTKGDANETTDPQQIMLTGRGSRVVYAVPYVGYLLHAQNAGWSKSLFITFPALGLAALALWSIWGSQENKSTPKPGRQAVIARLQSQMRDIPRVPRISL